MNNMAGCNNDFCFCQLKIPPLLWGGDKEVYRVRLIFEGIQI